MNNPINLHFYSPEEKLPDPKSTIIALLHNKYAEYACYGKYMPVFSTGQDFIEAYEDKNNDCRDEMIAWATFSPYWVVQQKQEE